MLYIHSDFSSMHMLENQLTVDGYDQSVLVPTCAAAVSQNATLAQNRVLKSNHKCDVYATLSNAANPGSETTFFHSQLRSHLFSHNIWRTFLLIMLNLWVEYIFPFVLSSFF